MEIDQIMSDSNEDRWIVDATATEKLCFMMLDQQRRLEDKLDAIMVQQETNERWMIYYMYTGSCWGAKLQYETHYERALHMVLCKLPEERQKELLRICFGRWADYVDEFYHHDPVRWMPPIRHVDHSTIRHRIPDCSEYTKILEELAFDTMSHKVWSMMTMDEVRMYASEFDYARRK